MPTSIVISVTNQMNFIALTVYRNDIQCNAHGERNDMEKGLFLALTRSHVFCFTAIKVINLLADSNLREQ